jgi:hypothetical protein
MTDADTWGAVASHARKAERRLAAVPERTAAQLEALALLADIQVLALQATQEGAP